ncbi:hypothetical protein IEQ34_009000 [Dendrobium chrysotoxum]|uniref:Uncharacterized protein n=1 Tax=Dendrobium chrysotoxum TaxID=161865 RepID=A0AAV7GZC7_DENCH|nr:hypothetical protein IEQ34_009000 [Dendrobium chrysotoxum]
MKNLPIPLHISAVDILKMINILDVEHLLYEVCYLSKYIDEEFLFKVELSVQVGRSNATMLKKSMKLLWRMNLKVEYTQSLNERNNKFMKIKNLQGEYKRKVLLDDVNLNENDRDNPPRIFDISEIKRYVSSFVYDHYREKKIILLIEHSGRVRTHGFGLKLHLAGDFLSVQSPSGRKSGSDRGLNSYNYRTAALLTVERCDIHVALPLLSNAGIWYCGAL